MMLQAPSPPPPTIAAAKSMNPETAATALIGNRPHGPIERAEWHPGFAPTTDDDAWRLELVEKPASLPGGCVRRRWAIKFFYRFDAPVATRLPEPPYAVTEVVLHAGADCGDGLPYARVNPGVEPLAAIGALQRVAALQRGTITASVTCTDQTGSGLCADAATTRRQLSLLQPWLVRRDGDATEVVLGQPGGITTTVRWTDAHPDVTAIRRQIPAPF